jgi:hypothetical protein
LVDVGVLVAAFVTFSSISCGAAEETGRYGQPVQITAYDVTLTPDFEANLCRVEAECRLHNFGSAPAPSASLYVLGTEATGTEVTSLEFQAEIAAGTWEKATAAETELPFASWLLDKAIKVYQVSLPRPLEPQQETTLRVSYVLSAPDPTKSDVLPALAKDQRELVLIADYRWLPTVPAGTSYVLTRYGRDQYDITYNPAWTVSVQAPAGYRAVAIDGEAVGENVWRSRAPGYPQVFVGRYQLTTVEDSGIAVDFYSPPGAQDGEALNAAARTLAKYYRLYADAFGQLRGARMNVLLTACPDFGGHGAYLGFAAEQGRLGEEGTLAHELAHGWWGCSVTSYGVGTKFLRESLTNWSMRWAMAKLGGRALPKRLESTTWRQYALVKAVFAVSPGWGGDRAWPRFSPIINYNPHSEVGDAQQAYQQGTALLSEIAETVGEAAFLKALRTFATTYQDSYCTLDDFLGVLRESTGRDFGPFFKERSATGLDTYLHSFYVASGLRSYRRGSSWETEVTILNKGTHETVCPVELRMSRGKVERTIQVPPGEVRTLRFTTDAEVKSLAIDPRWEPLPIPGEDTWRGINLPSDDPWELARRMTPESMGLENWAWYLHALALAQGGQWQACADALTEFDTSAQAVVGHSVVRSFSAYMYLRGVAFLHLGQADKAAADMADAIDDLVGALAGVDAARVPELPALFSFKHAGIITDEGDLVFANYLLKLLTGQDFGFDPRADKAANAAALARWQAWWKEHRSSYRVPSKLLQHPDLLVIFGA